MSDIRYWSGGNLYPSVYEAAECAGLDVNSDWKNPHLQQTPLELVGVNPWRPSGDTDGVNLTAFTTRAPNGSEQGCQPVCKCSVDGKPEGGGQPRGGEIEPLP